MHILPHYVKADATKLPAKFPDWIQSHHEWVEAITNPVLLKKGSNVDDYINFIAKPGTPVDEIGLLIFARMYHLHMCIIMEDRCWTMQCEHDVDVLFLLPTEVHFFSMIPGQNTRSNLYVQESQSQPKPDINVTKVGHQKPVNNHTTWTSYKGGIMSDKEIDELWRKYNRPRPMSKPGIPVVKLEHTDNEKKVIKGQQAYKCKYPQRVCQHPKAQNSTENQMEGFTEMPN